MLGLGLEPVPGHGSGQAAHCGACGSLSPTEACVDDSPQLLPSTGLSGFSGSCRPCTAEVIPCPCGQK